MAGGTATTTAWIRTASTVNNFTTKRTWQSVWLKPVQISRTARTTASTNTTTTARRRPITSRRADCRGREKLRRFSHSGEAQLGRPSANQMLKLERQRRSVLQNALLAHIWLAKRNMKEGGSPIGVTSLNNIIICYENKHYIIRDSNPAPQLGRLIY